MLRQTSKISESQGEYKSSAERSFPSPTVASSSDSSTVQQNETIEITRLSGVWEIISWAHKILLSLSIACAVLITTLTLTTAVTFVVSWVLTSHMPRLTFSGSLDHWTYSSSLTRYTDAPDFDITLMIPLLLGILVLPALTSWFSREDRRLFHQLLHSDNVRSLDAKIAGLFRKGFRSEAEQMLLEMLPTATADDYHRLLLSRQRLLHCYLKQTQKSSSPTTQALRIVIREWQERTNTTTTIT